MQSPPALPAQAQGWAALDAWIQLGIYLFLIPLES